MTNPWFSFRRVGFRLEVFANRIEVAQGTFLREKDVLPTRNISDVQVDKFGHLFISTNDGRRRRYQLGLRANEARLAILRSL